MIRGILWPCRLKAPQRRLRQPRAAGGHADLGDECRRIARAALRALDVDALTGLRSHNSGPCLFDRRDEEPDAARSALGSIAPQHAKLRVPAHGQRTGVEGDVPIEERRPGAHFRRRSLRIHFAIGRPGHSEERIPPRTRVRQVSPVQTLATCRTLEVYELARSWSNRKLLGRDLWMHVEGEPCRPNVLQQIVAAGSTTAKAQLQPPPGCGHGC
mmetsp:Transcript_69856/g.227300  ORF Transcript_69856/g.227300 Transcript_69856/m.227300 type:complete len:214 (+) Transcript_69856:106-747(+)